MDFDDGLNGGGLSDGTVRAREIKPHKRGVERWHCYLIAGLVPFWLPNSP